MLRSDGFLEKENAAPLLIMDQGYLAAHGQDLLEQAAEWPSFVGVDPSACEINLPEPTIETPEIVYRDVDRTLTDSENQAFLRKFLTLINEKFGDYAQALSYVGGYLLLSLEPPVVMNMLLQLNSNKTYVPGYWKSEAVGFATDAYVFRHLVQQKFPEVEDRLAQLYIFPETYCQKWFKGLCVQILPFNVLNTYFHMFLKHGVKYLLCFGLSLVEQRKEELLAAKDQVAVYAILRLDKSFFPNAKETKDEDELAAIGASLYTSIVEGAEKYLDFVGELDEQMESLREEMFKTHLEERLRLARERACESSSEESSDLDSSELDSEDEENFYQG